MATESGSVIVSEIPHAARVNHDGHRRAENRRLPTRLGHHCAPPTRYLCKWTGLPTGSGAGTPAATRFGTLCFTPVELDRNNDRDSLKSYGSGRITLDTAADRNASVMLHIYNFRLVTPPRSLPQRSDGSAFQAERRGFDPSPAPFPISCSRRHSNCRAPDRPVDVYRRSRSSGRCHS